MNSFRAGMWAGVLATGPMTLAMLASQKRLPRSERSPLPPATLTYQITGSRNPDVTLLSHFAYGVCCALAYAGIFKKSTSPPIIKGTVYGLLIWSASYLGWIPVVGLRSSALNMSLKRNAMMIFAHIVWGSMVGYATDRLQKTGTNMLDGARKAPYAE